MRIILANPRGFCAGVNMAVDAVEQVLSLFGPPIWVYHEIVHNHHVVERFRSRGVTFVDDLDSVPEGRLVIFSAHGVSPQVREHAKRRKLRVIDATCPLVTKVHMEALRYARQGYEILLIGHKGHQEVVGTLGEAPATIQIVESPTDVADLRVRDPDKLVYLMQTTLSLDDAKAIVEALQERFPNIKAPPTDDICYATTNRQNAVRAIAPSCDMVIVVGSRNSSNSARLMEIAEAQNTKALLIDDVTELDLAHLTGNETILITAGASAPEDLVEDLVRTLHKTFDGAVEQCNLSRETVRFEPPAALRAIMRQRGDPHDPHSVQQDTPHAADEPGMYAGDIPLTTSSIPLKRSGS
ncbi:MAG: 4-hydroxy-3-methylbut-2-enyl diphosphate reductase [Phycisphaerales bacterium]|nr:4-hydroxy-3-methylbut-2-enyl diphosphate reductase [Phycisphaerales bacterium]